jgi:hypothetical protein
MSVQQQEVRIVDITPQCSSEEHTFVLALIDRRRGHPPFSSLCQVTGVSCSFFAGAVYDIKEEQRGQKEETQQNGFQRNQPAIALRYSVPVEQHQ